MGVGCGGPGEDLEDLWEYLKREIIWGIWELDVEWGALLFLCLLSIFHLLLPFLLVLCLPQPHWFSQSPLSISGIVNFQEKANI